MKEKLFKKGITRRLFSVVLALAMVVAMLPLGELTVYAADTNYGGLQTIKGVSITVTGNSWYLDKNTWKCCANSKIYIEDDETKWSQICLIGGRGWLDISNVDHEAFTCSECGATISWGGSHTFNMDSWSSDSTGHWHPATCTHTDQKNSFTAHTDHWDATTGKCTVCEYECTHEDSTSTETCSICGKALHSHIWKYSVGEGNDSNKVTFKCEGSGTCEVTLNSPSFFQVLDNPFYNKTIREWTSFRLCFDIKNISGSQSIGWNTLFSFYNTTTGGRISISSAPYVCYNENLSANNKYIDYNRNGDTLVDNRITTLMDGNKHSVEIEINDKDYYKIKVDSTVLTFEKAGNANGQDLLNFLSKCDKFILGGSTTYSYWPTQKCEISNFNMSICDHSNVTIPNNWVCTTEVGCTNCQAAKVAPNHTFVLSAEDNVLTAKCQNPGCSKSVALTLTASSPNYSGSPVSKATLFGGMDFAAFNNATKLNLSAADVKIYSATDTAKATELSEITEVGSYVAELTVDDDKTATLEFDVVRSPITYTFKTIGTDPWTYNWDASCADMVANALANAGVGDTIILDIDAYSSVDYQFIGGPSSWNTTGNCRNGYSVKITKVIPEGYKINKLTVTKSQTLAFLCEIVSTHEHNWQYSVGTGSEANKLIATCSAADCNLTDNKVTLTLAASSANYSGSAYTGASLEGGTEWTAAVGGTAPKIMYVGRGATSYTESETAPTNVGTYTAKITVGDPAVTASVDFDIHGASTTYDSDDTNHWFTCAISGCTDTAETHKFNKAAHSYNATSHECVCGKIDPTYHKHVVGTKHEAVPGNCVDKGTIEYYDCAGTLGGACGKKLDASGNELTSIEGTKDATKHKGTATTWTKTATTHKETYDCCGAVKTAEANHTGGTATCLAKAKCTVCEAEYGELGNHNWGSWTTAADEKSCTRVCANDETHKETTEHTGTTCDKCNWVKHTHKVKADSKVEAKAATCVAAGNIEYYLCDGCGVKLDKDGNILDNVEISIDADAHNWGSWTTAADEKSCTRVCANDAEHKETTEHTGTSCDKCGWSKQADVNKGVDELSKLLDDTTNKEDKVVYSQQNINDQGRLAYTVNKAKIKKIVVTSLDGVSTNITMTVNAKAKFVLPGGDTKWTVDSASGVKNKVSKYNKKAGGCIIVPKAKKNGAYDQVLTSENGYKVTLHVEDLKISKEYKKMTVSTVNGTITITPVDGTEKATGIQAGIWSCRRPKTSTTKAKLTNIGAAGSTAQVSIGRKATATAVVNADGSVTLSNATGKGTAVMIYRVNNRTYSVKIKFAEPKKTK